MIALSYAVAFAVAGLPPSVHREATFQVKEQLGIPFAQGVLCDPRPCVQGDES
jgi:hypothetical protein